LLAETLVRAAVMARVRERFMPTRNPGVARATVDGRDATC